MKYFWISLIVCGFVLISFVQPIYAPPSVNPDWQDYPYCPGGCPQEFLIEEWKEYYDMKGKEWMEQKKQELDSVISNYTLKEWIESDPSMANANVYQYYWTQGEIPNMEGEYIGTIPSCDDSESIHPADLCHVDATPPPCPEPTFRKNGLCVIEKMNFADYASKELTAGDMCGKGTVLVDGVCQVVKTDTVGSDAPFFGIFVYLDNLISWIFGR